MKRVGFRDLDKAIEKDFAGVFSEFSQSFISRLLPVLVLLIISRLSEESARLLSPVFPLL